NFSSRFWLRGTCGCELWTKSRPNQDKNRRFCRWVFLVHPARIRQNIGRDQNRSGLLRWNRTEPDLQPRDVGKNKLSRINRNHLRPGEDFLRAASRHLLATNRSHPIRRSVHRYRTELSRCDLLWERRGNENCPGFESEACKLRKIQTADCDRNL